MRRDGAELMKGSKKRWQMHGRWMEQSGRIFERLLGEVNGSLVSNLRLGEDEEKEDFWTAR